ncbi:SixA phosphatase family protein [Psychrobacter lutiphocae]|uniref:SixA phosphatase family protein n=1 Tax=Psychrobacter lutiphocae TaxID=540500 RepID=UPI0003761C7D|nr:histidine phosphatase family protein [Psychrobacter lutiphocae]
MQLILMRHGQAGYYNADNTPVNSDAERQLTAVGRQQAQQTAEAIFKHYQPDLYVVSPYIRAKQTLEAFTLNQPQVPHASSVELALSANFTPVIELESITPDANPLKALHALLNLTLEANEIYKAQDLSPLQCVLVVCHMPIVAKMAGLLTAQSAEAYGLAEARVFETELIAADMGIEIDRVEPIAR